MEFKHYMKVNFPNLSLKPPLFYSWDVGIRFELGANWIKEDCAEESFYLKGVYERVITLFRSLHSPEEEIFVVANVNDFGDNGTFKHRINIFSLYVKDKAVLYKLKHTELCFL